MNATTTALDGWVPIAEYAEAAGIKLATARKKASGGQIVATKIGLAWYVNLAAEVEKNLNTAPTRGRRRRTRQTFP